MVPIFVLVGVYAGGINSADAVTTYDAATVAIHNNQNDCWIVISGKVYNVTNFIPVHPGGTAIVPYCGQDATAAFVGKPHSSYAYSLLPTYYVGDLSTTTSPSPNPPPIPSPSPSPSPSPVPGIEVDHEEDDNEPVDIDEQENDNDEQAYEHDSQEDNVSSPASLLSHEDEHDGESSETIED